MHTFSTLHSYSTGIPEDETIDHFDFDDMGGNRFRRPSSAENIYQSRNSKQRRSLHGDSINNFPSRYDLGKTLYVIYISYYII